MASEKRIYIVSTFDEKKIYLNSFSHVFMTYYPLIIQTWSNLNQMYPGELEIKNTTERNTSASHLDFLF